MILQIHSFAQSCGTFLPSDSISQSFEKKYVAAFRQGNEKDLEEYTLPVVVHIVHDGGTEQLSTAQIQQGIDYLNAGFANGGDYGAGPGWDTKIEFCLAQQDPDGNATDGIVYTQSEATHGGVSAEDIVNSGGWDNDSYLNIWVVKELCTITGENCTGVAGYALVSEWAGYQTEGIYVEANYFGTSAQLSSLLIHEAGHYLGLLHTFSGGCTNDDCLTDGDRVCDTPPDNSTAYVPCGSFINSCDTDTNSGLFVDQADRTWNFMDYGWSCYSEFTLGQAQRMQYNIENVRPGLMNSIGCQPICLSPLTANFTVSADSVPVGSTISFNNTSVNATNFLWKINGLETFVTQDLTYTFDTPGYYNIELTANNADIYCTETHQEIIYVYCTVETEILWSEIPPDLGDTITFTAQTNSENFMWTVNGTEYAGSETFTVILNEEQSYLIGLRAFDAYCEDLSTEMIVIQGTASCEEEPETFVYEYSKNILSGRIGIDDFVYSVRVPTNDDAVLGLNISQSFRITKFDTFGKVVKVRDFYREDYTENPVLAQHLRSYKVGNDIAILSRLSDNGLFGLVNLTVIDTSLNVKFSRVIYHEAPNVRKYNIIRTTAGNYLVTIVLENFQEQTAILELDSEGNNLRTKIITNEPVDGNYYLRGGLHETDEDNFILIEDHTITAFNLDTGVLWYRRFEFYEEGYWLNFHSSSSANEKICLTTATGLNLTVLLDNEGGVEWVKKLNYLNTTTDTTALPQGITTFLEDDEIIFSSLSYNSSPTAPELHTAYHLTKLDLSGELVWHRSTNLYEPSSNQGIGFPVTFYKKDNHYYSFIGLSTYLKFDNNGYFPDCTPLDYQATMEDVPFNIIELEASMRDTILPEYININLLSQNTTGYRLDPCNLLRADASLDILNQNNCSNSVEVTVRICNNGQKTLAPDTPVRIYTQDPTAYAAEPLYILQTGMWLSDNTCDTITLNLPDITATDSLLHFVINDDGSAVPPYDFAADFFSAEQQECIYTNNLDTLHLPDFTPLTLDFPNDTVFCEAVAITLVAPPGFTTYTWQGDTLAGTYSVTAPGVYTAAVTDNCGLIQTDSVVVEQYENAADLNLGADLSLCTGGTASLSLPDYPSVLWSDGSSGSDITFSLPGSYAVTVTDQCGNVESDTLQVLENFTAFDLGDDMTVCPAEPVVLTLPPGYTNINWFPAALPCTDCSEIIIEPLADMTVALIAENAEGCQVSDTLHIAVRNIEQTLGIVPPTCSYSADGTLTVQSPLNLTYSLDGIDFSAVGTFSGLPSGDYQLTTADSADCLYITNFSVPTVPEFVLDFGTDTVVYAGSVFPLVAPAGYAEYIWSPAAAVDCFACPQTTYNGNYTGILTLTVTDSTGCTASSGFQITFPAGSPAFTTSGVSCHGTADGTLSLTPAPDTRYSLDGVNFTTTAEFTGLSADSYILYSEDALGDVHEVIFSITEPAPLLLQVTTDTTITRGAEVTLAAEVTGGTPPYTYTRQPTDFLDCPECVATLAVPPYSLDYSAGVTDSAGCAATARTRITVENEYRVFIPNSFSPNGDGINDFFSVYGGANVEQVVSLQVYARKGDLVFEQQDFAPNDESIGWNGIFRGEPLNSGIYVYVTTVRFSDGTEKIFAGDVGLVR